MVTERLCDALSITYWKGDSCEDYEYRLSDVEMAMLLPAMNAYCKEQTGMDLKEYSAGAIAEQREPDAIRSPKRNAKQNSQKGSKRDL